VSAQTATRVSTPESITAASLGDEMDAKPTITRILITTAQMCNEMQTETPHLSSKHADEQAVQPLTLPATEYVDTVDKWDVLSGRGGKANHHTGNKRYRKVVSEMKAMYRATAAKTAKTELSKYVVQYVGEYGGRFLNKDEEGRYFVMTKAEARKKTSQALRESKQVKWTDDDVEDDVQVEK
jgi:hypothetical protein